MAAAAGIALGFAAPEVGRQLTPVSDVFLRLIRAIIAPLLFSVLVRAVAGAGEARNLGRIGVRAIIVFEVLTTIALLLGWLAGVWWRPGEGVALPLEAVVLGGHGDTMVPLVRYSTVAGIPLPDTSRPAGTRLGAPRGTR
mgnify:CR=1 FL=1